MSGLVWNYRLVIKIPPLCIPGPIRTPSRPQNYLRLSLQTSDTIRTATDANFSDCMSSTAYTRDLQEYAELYGSHESELMQDHLKLLNISPTNYLRHIYYLVNLHKMVDPSRSDDYFKIQSGLYPFMFTWTRAVVNTDPPPQASPSPHPSDEEWE